MKPLSQYILEQQMSMTIDGHAHLFNHESSIYPYLVFAKCIGFEDIEFIKLNQYEGGATLTHYDNYIKNHDLSNIILCATGVEAETIIETHKKHKDIIRGFGELKCYAKTKHDAKLPFCNLSWFKPVLEYNDTLIHPLPVIIHYNLDSESKIGTFGRFLDKYPNQQIVLCHCGMPGHDYDSKLTDVEISHAVQKLQQDHPNLWLDISFSALDYFSQNPMGLLNFDTNRIYLGTDINPAIYRLNKYREYSQDTFSKLTMVQNLIPSDDNITRLFRL